MISPFRIVITFVACSLFGLAFLPLLTVDLQPNYEAPKIWVHYSLPNASPEIVEQEGTAPLENILSQISELEKIKSTSNHNKGSITLTFDKNADMDFKRFEVSSLIRQMHPKLSRQLSYPTISQGSDSRKSRPMLSFSFNAPFSPYQIKQTLQEVVQKKLFKTEGISDVQITGAENIQVVIRFDRNRLNNYGISKKDILDAIHTNSKSYHLGMAKNHSGQQFFVKVPATLNQISDLEHLIVKTVKDEKLKTIKQIRLKEVADVFMESEEPHGHFRINGLNAVRMAIKVDEEVNKLVLSDQIRRLVDNTVMKLPNGYEIYLDYDESQYIQEELDKIYYRTGLSVLILILFIFLIHRSWRYLVVLFSGIMVNICLTIGVVYFLEIRVHLYTLAGITVSLGLIMDNAIVMLDHLSKLKNKKILLPLTAATITTIIALMMTFLLPEVDKRNLIEFAEIITISLVISLIVAIGYTPAAHKLIFDL